MCVQNLNIAALAVPEIIGGTPKIGQSLDTPTLPFLQNFSWAFTRMDPLNVRAKFQICSFFRSRDNRGYQKIWAVPGYAHASFTPKFYGLLFEWTL